MFSNELVKILQKYQDTNQSQISSINDNITNIIKSISDIRSNLSEKLQDLLQQGKNADELYNDIKALNEQILRIQTIKIVNQIDKKAEIIYSVVEEFSNKIYLYIVDDDLCPMCNVKLIQHTIYYEEKENDRISKKFKKWYCCPNCYRLFALDYDVEDFKTENTNIVFNTQYYNYNKVFFHDAIVIFNINKCSAHNHKIEDLTCDLPVILSDGTIEYVTVPIIYCKTCKRYVMLKSIYNKLKGIPACIIIDETHDRTSFTEEDFFYGDNKGGSKLYKYGYNVNCTDKLTVEQRHTILVMQLLSHNITKGEIFSILDTNINNGIKRKNSKKDWSKAVDKWMEDKEFVKNVNLEEEAHKIDINRLVLKFANNQRL